MTRNPSASQTSLPPGSTLGVFGGGQLARMFAVAADRMGYRTIVFAPEPDSPAAHMASAFVCAPYDDDDRVVQFCRQCDAVTIEFENIPVQCLQLASQHTIVRPGPGVLAVAQDRLEERRVLDRHGLPTADHAAVRSMSELTGALESVGTPGVLKSARSGYDGRGQAKITTPEGAAEAWESVGATETLYESWVDYEREVSVIVARSVDGVVETFGPVENHHENHILDVSRVPAQVSDQVASNACELACEVAKAVDLEGLLCVELFVTRSGDLLINELAPRPHNSGHLTIEACEVSQFEQQVRVLCNLPLGKMTLRGPAAMKNLLGDLWSNRPPDWTAIRNTPKAFLHLYGKSRPRVGRKMGHVTVLDKSPEAAVARVNAIVGSIRKANGATSPQHSSR